MRVLAFLALSTAVAHASHTKSPTIISAQPSTVAANYPDVRTFGTFNLSILGSAPPYFAIRTHQEEELLPNRTKQIRHATYLRELPGGKPLKITALVNGTTMDTNLFMDQYGLAGLIILKDGAILLEKQQYGHQHASRHVIQSCTKSFLTIALGIAIHAWKFSLKDRTDTWVPELKSSPYKDLPIQNLVEMTAGVSIPATYPSIHHTVYMDSNSTAVFELFRTYTKFAKPGEKFLYTDQNYYVASVALTRALGETVESYVSRNIWEPAGMQYDGYMRATAAVQVDGHGGLAISLTDQARFGLLVMDSLKGKGGPKVPKGWFQQISEGTTARGVRAPGVIFEMGDFGYQMGWWILPKSKRGGKYAMGDDGAFTALGWGGQTIYVIPKLNTVVAMQSSYPIHIPELFNAGMEFATAVALELRR